jgi:hypothetical protein
MNPFRTATRLVGLVMSSGLALGLLVVASPADAAGTPSGPQYTYRMTNVYKSGSLVKSEALSSIMCLQRSGTVSYSTSSTRSNSFSVTGGLSFSTLKGLLGSAISVSGGITTSTTVTETLTMNLSANQCARVYALRDKYAYTLQKKCNWACSGTYYDKQYHSIGSGSYTKFVGRKFYLYYV